MLKIGFENTDGRTALVVAMPVGVKNTGIRYEIVLTLSPTGRQRKGREFKSVFTSIERVYPTFSLIDIAWDRLVYHAGGREGWTIRYINDAEAKIPSEFLVSERVVPKMRPHKGGRSVSINVRLTPETHKRLKALNISVSDWIEQKLKEENNENL